LNHLQIAVFLILTKQFYSHNFNLFLNNIELIKESSILVLGDKPRGILKDDSLETLSGIHPAPRGAG